MNYWRQQEQHKKRMEAMERVSKRVASNKEAAREFLIKAGIVDEDGELTSMYK